MSMPFHLNPLQGNDQHKHKKALSSLISPQINIPVFKTVQSPSISQMTTTSFSPNVSHIENFIKNFQNHHKSFQKPLNTTKSKFVSPLKAINKEEMKSEYQNWITSNQLEASTIIFPKEFQNLKNSNGFHPFYTGQKQDIIVPSKLTGPMSGRNFIKKHLSFNENQTKLIQDSVSVLQMEQYAKLFIDIKKKNNLTTQLMKRTSKVKKMNNVSNSQRNFGVDFLEADEENEESEGLIYKFYVNMIESQDAINKPSIREAATMTIINFTGYLYGGLSNKLINTIHQLEPSKKTIFIR
jgi:hypothetical protein